MKLKVCILKQPYITEFTWASLPWSGAEKLLDSLVSRSQNFGLVYETQADVWVVVGSEYVSSAHTRLMAKPAVYKELGHTHTAVPWSSIPFGEYDVVISIDSVIPDSVIVKHPRTLWCYYEYEHTMPSFRESRIKPYGCYDLFLNHALTSSNVVDSLPASVAFPYLVSRRAFEEVLPVTKSDRVFLDSHCIRGVKDLVAFEKHLTRIFGMEVVHSTPWDYRNSYLAVARKQVDSPRVYLSKLAGSKYCLLNRDGYNRVGQSVIEAAALGVIVLASGSSAYAKRACHPAAKVRSNDYRSAARVVKQIQRDPKLQGKILAHQYWRIQEYFLDQPLALLRECLEIKRR